MENGISDHLSNVSQINNSRRAKCLGEMERERVRNISELVQMISQQRGSRGSRRDAQLHEGAQADQAHDVVANNDESQPEHVRWDMSRLRRRQALVDLLVKIERERQRELQGLFEHRAVSDFAHRNRIQVCLVLY